MKTVAEAMVDLLTGSVVIDPIKGRIQRLRCSVREAAKLHEETAAWDSYRLGRSAYRKTFITLTYRNGRDWQRRHISEFVKRLRQWMGRRNCRAMYVWVAETQKRGALHYHLLVWVPRRLRLPRPDTCGWWPHGMSNIETARNPVGYMVKYATKTGPDDLKRLKRGVRLHGNGGHDPIHRVRLRETLAPWWIRQESAARHVAAWRAEDERCAAWEARRVRVEWTDSGGDRWVRYDDPDGPPYESDAWWLAKLEHDERRDAQLAQLDAYAAAYGSKGFPEFQRVRGGFVDLRAGELIPSPWKVEFSGGLVFARKRVPETLQ